MSENPYASPRAGDVAATRPAASAAVAGRQRAALFLPPTLILGLFCAVTRRSPLEALGRDAPVIAVGGIIAYRLFVSYATYFAAGRALTGGSRRAAWTTAVLASVPYVSPWGLVGLPIGWALCFSLRRAPP